MVERPIRARSISGDDADSNAGWRRAGLDPLKSSVVSVQVLAATADETGQEIFVLVTILVLIAALLAVLTVWYWFITDPKQRLAEGSDDAAATPGEVAPSSPPVLDGLSTISPATTGEIDRSLVTAGADGQKSAPAKTSAEEVSARTRSIIDGIVAGQQDAKVGRSQARSLVGSDASVGAGKPGVAGSLNGDTLAPSELDGDELAAARQRRHAMSGGLTDDDWSSVRQSVFDHYRS